MKSTANETPVFHCYACWFDKIKETTTLRDLFLLSVLASLDTIAVLQARDKITYFPWRELNIRLKLYCIDNTQCVRVRLVWAFGLAYEHACMWKCACDSPGEWGVKILWATVPPDHILWCCLGRREVCALRQTLLQHPNDSIIRRIIVVIILFI